MQLVSEMLMGGCGVEQDGVAELWEAAWISVWDLFSIFFSGSVSTSPFSRFRTGHFQCRFEKKMTLCFNLLLHHVV